MILVVATCVKELRKKRIVAKKKKNFEENEDKRSCSKIKEKSLIYIIHTYDGTRFCQIVGLKLI